MLRLKALIEKKNELAGEIRRQADAIGVGNPTAEQQAAWDAVNADYNANEQAITRQTRADEVSANLGNRAPNPSLNGNAGGIERTRELALTGFFRQFANGGRGLTDQHVEAMGQCGIQRGQTEIEICLSGDTATMQDQFHATHPSNRRSLHRDPQFGATGSGLSIGTSAPFGGYLVPPGTLSRALEINMLSFSGVRQVADVMRSDNGEPFIWPSVDDTPTSGELHTESADASTVVDATMGKTTWNAWEYDSKAVRFTAALAQDAAFDLPTVLGGLLGERLGRVTNVDYTTGSGTSKPTGIVVGAALGKTAASAVAMVWDEVIDLIHSIDPAYRSRGMAFMAHDLIFAYLRKLKDSNGAYVWRPAASYGGVGDKFVDTIDGKPIFINQAMASTMATTNKVLLAGNLNAYKIRDVQNVKIRVLNELYAMTNEIGMIAFLRTDGKVLNAGTPPIKYLQLA